MITLSSSYSRLRTSMRCLHPKDQKFGIKQIHPKMIVAGHVIPIQCNLYITAIEATGQKWPLRRFDFICLFIITKDQQDSLNNYILN